VERKNLNLNDKEGLSHVIGQVIFSALGVSGVLTQFALTAMALPSPELVSPIAAQRSLCSL